MVFCDLNRLNATNNEQIKTAGFVKAKKIKPPDTAECVTDLAREIKLKMSVVSITSCRKRHLASKQECY